MPRPKASSEKISQPEHDEASVEYQRGMNEIRKQLGPMADSYIEKIKALAPEFAWVNVTFPFGELYTRDVLDLKTRELCTVAALTVQGFSLPELKVHIHAALRCGASREEVIEVITQMIAYAGFPAATNALMTAQAVFKDLDAPEEAKQAAE
jgi:4-carboxymuconolactone decarboxylase